MNVLVAAGGAVITALLAVPIVRVALFPVFDQTSANPWSDLGPLDNFKNLGKPLTQPLAIERRDGWSLADNNQTLYVVAGSGGQPRVLSSVCPHLGCTVVLKPAEQTPLSALRLGELIAEAGIPDGVVNIVPGYGETAGAALAAHPDVDKVAFTGSTEVGKLILQAASGNLKKVSLELGGKSPNVVFADADLESAIPGAASAIFFNHGQCCCAGSRLYVEEKAFDRVVDGVAQQAEKLRVGPGIENASDMGPLVSEEQLNRVCGYLESGLSEGAKAVTGGSRQGDKGYFVKPTVLVNTNAKMKVVQEEIFGPVVTAIPFRDLEEIVPRANDSIYGLAAGVWTRDIKKAHTLASKLKAGTVWINCYNIFDAALPFGGYKQSGWGREMGHEVLEQYTETKAVCAAL